MRTPYSEGFKHAALKKLLDKGSRSLEEMVTELGISKSVAYKWMNESGKVPSTMNTNRRMDKGNKQWSAPEKFRAVMEFEQLKTEPLKQGDFLRKSGLHGS